MAAHPDLAPVELDRHLRVLVDLPGGASESRGEHEHAQLAAGERVNGEPGAHEQGAELVHALVLADGVEAAVEDALASLQLAEQPPERFGSGGRTRRQIGRLRGLEVVAQLAQARRVLAHQ
ncbi:MAG: hypothetical protein OXD50_09205 [Chloroflexi bacterium]|nr:hypothetical protein [Chloroflexota bacterium]